MSALDAIIVGSGPNGLAAGIALCSWGHSVRIYEKGPSPGGGLHSLELSEEGYVHDQCSAIHPMGYLSPFFRGLSLEDHGLRWCSGRSSVAHPLDDGPAAILYRDFARTSERLGAVDGARWRALFEPFSSVGVGLLADLMGPFQIPKHMLAALRFALVAHRSAHGLARGRFEQEPARALFAGLAAHSILPLQHRLTAAFGLIFGTSAHLADWPCARGGSGEIARALVSKFRSLGGEIVTETPVGSIDELPESRVVLLDTSPLAVSQLAGHVLPSRYKRKLLAFNYGPATYKVDYTLDGPIPWRDAEISGASTVHVGGTHEEIAASEYAAWHGRPPDKPYLILCQQSELDATRAPSGKHTGYVYCHVPHGFSGDATSAIEGQIERFAPGFRDLVRTRHVTTPKDFARLNPNLVGERSLAARRVGINC